MSSFSELIKSFGKTRDYVRDFLIYGFKVRGDFTRRSSRTYDDEKRRVESWLGDYLRYDSSVRGKQTSISVDSGHSAENPLYQAYYARSFTDRDIQLHFLLLDLLADGEARTLREITDGLNAQYGAALDEQTVRGKLLEYVREGIMLRGQRGRLVTFRLMQETVPALLARYPELEEAVQFFSEQEEFGIVGNMLLRGAGRRNCLFFRKHNYIVHTLEDEALLPVLDAMERKCSLRIRTFSSRSAEGREAAVIPMQILSASQTGRRWLLAYCPETDRFSGFRLDYLESAKPEAPYAEYDALRERYLKEKAQCFGVSFPIPGKVCPEPLVVVFRIDPETEGFVIDRIRREMRCGKLEKAGAQRYRLTLAVFDPNEAMQWIKTFTGRIESVTGGTEAVRQRWYEDIRRMQEVYGDDIVS